MIIGDVVEVVDGQFTGITGIVAHVDSDVVTLQIGPNYFIKDKIGFMRPYTFTQSEPTTLLNDNKCTCGAHAVGSPRSQRLV